ncbi:hypothetical protein FGO68_gene4929 [Halteria grandinella]|uniref:C2 domain-containing protein n=1 Tax=Halteria grandinella TaxID=5974 RepID=A0A8J8TA04_HALGN|nr:hypothetical protein FGO68_gene4929 [Halteria grandinella]
MKIKAIPGNILKMQAKVHGPYRLTLTILSAQFDKSTDLVGKMDPYVVLEHALGANDTQNMKKIKGPTHKGGHKTPKWDWKVELYYGGGTKEMLKLSVFEEDLTSDEFIGDTGMLELQDLVLLGSSQKQASSRKELTLTMGSAKAGKILLEILLEDLSLPKAVSLPGILTLEIISAQLSSESFNKPKPMIVTVTIGTIVAKGSEGGDILCLPIKNEKLQIVNLTLSEDNGKRPGKQIGTSEIPIMLLIGSISENTTVQVYDEQRSCSGVIKLLAKYEQEKKIEIKPFVEHVEEKKIPISQQKNDKLPKGQLELFIESANLYRDTDTFTKMDPFVMLNIINFSKQTQIKVPELPNTLRTKTCQKGGQKPQWKEKFPIVVNDQEPRGVTIQVFDEDIKHHDLVGETRKIDIKELCLNKVHTFQLNYKSLLAGTITLQTIFIPDLQAPIPNIPAIPKQLPKEREKPLPRPPTIPIEDPDDDREPLKPVTISVTPLNVAAISKPVQQISPQLNSSARGLHQETSSRKQKKSPLPTLRLKSTRRRHKSVAKPNKSWNNRFFIDGVANYTEAHPYFKQYFDKPVKKTPYTRFRQINMESTKQIQEQLSSPRGLQPSNSPKRAPINTNSENILNLEAQGQREVVKKHSSNLGFQVRDPSIKELLELRKGGSSTEMKFYMPQINQPIPVLEGGETTARYKLKKTLRGMSKASDHHSQHADYLYGKYFKNFETTIPLKPFNSGIVHGSSTLAFPHGINQKHFANTAFARPSVAALPGLKQNMRQMKEVYGQERVSPSMNVYLFAKRRNSKGSEKKKQMRHSSIENSGEAKALTLKYSKWAFE